MRVQSFGLEDEPMIHEVGVISRWTTATSLPKDDYWFDSSAEVELWFFMTSEKTKSIDVLSD